MLSEDTEDTETACLDMDFSPICTCAEQILRDLPPLLTAELSVVPINELHVQLSSFIQGILCSHRAFVHVMHATKSLDSLIQYWDGKPESELLGLTRALERLIIAHDYVVDGRKIYIDVKMSIEALLDPVLATHGSSVIQVFSEKSDTKSPTVSYVSIQTLAANIIGNLNKSALASQSLITWLMRFRSLFENEDVILSSNEPIETWMIVARQFLDYATAVEKLQEQYAALFPFKLATLDSRNKVREDYITRRLQIKVPTPKAHLQAKKQFREEEEDGYTRAPHHFHVHAHPGEECYEATLTKVKRSSTNTTDLEFAIHILPKPDWLLSSFIVQSKFRSNNQTLDPSAIRVTEFLPKNGEQFFESNGMPFLEPTLRTSPPSPGIFEWRFGRRLSNLFTAFAFPTKFRLDLKLEHSEDIVVDVGIIVVYRRWLQKKVERYPSLFPAAIRGAPSEQPVATEAPAPSRSDTGRLLHDMYYFLSVDL